MGQAAIQTYRYLRIGLVGAVVLLAAAILVERGEVDCWQTSISGYYYTPARAIFVGMLIAVGLALIVVKGRTPWVDVALNSAGMVAPLVAVVPTTNVGTCWSIAPPASPLDPDGTLAGWVVADIDNNVWALILTGIIGLVAWLVLVAATRGFGGILDTGSASLRWGLLVTAGFIVGVWWAFRSWDRFAERAHGLAAVAFFVFLGIAVLLNARAVRGVEGKRIYLVLYLAVLGGMIAAAVPLLVAGWDHNVLVVEAAEITLFAVFWAVQTVELWDTTAAPPAA